MYMYMLYRPSQHHKTIDICLLHLSDETNKFQSIYPVIQNYINYNYIDGMLSKAHSEQKKLNSYMLLTTMLKIQSLVRQGLALKEHSDSKLVSPSF